MEDYDCVGEELYKASLSDYRFSRNKISKTIARVDKKPQENINNSKNINDTTPSLQLRIDDEIQIMIRKLPITFDETILVCQNSKNPRILSALIMGPADTPYDSACILFDINIPVDYPESPPKFSCRIKSSFITPFIMNDGEVTISFLKKNNINIKASFGYWDPIESSIYKVLCEIQDTMFNETPYLNNIFTKHSTVSPWIMNDAINYNKQIHRIIAAEGIYNILIKPPFEFADAIRCHFTLKRKHIKRTLKEWVDEENTGDQLRIYQNKTLREWVCLIVTLLASFDKSTQNTETKVLEDHIDDVETDTDTKDNTSNDYDASSDNSSESELPSNQHEHNAIYNMPSSQHNSLNPPSFTACLYDEDLDEEYFL